MKRTRAGALARASKELCSLEHSGNYQKEMLPAGVAARKGARTFYKCSQITAEEGAVTGRR